VSQASRQKPRADLAIDLGTTHTRVFTRQQQTLLQEPTVIAINNAGRKGPEVVAIGEQALDMWGRTPPGTTVIRPVKNGLVVDFESAELFLGALLKKAGLRGLRKPRLIMAVPEGQQESDRRALQHSVGSAGIRLTHMMNMSQVAALGAELPIMKPMGNMIVDIGGGRTDSAVISLGGLVVHRSSTVAGDAMDQAIVEWTQEQYGLAISPRNAEKIKKQVGSAAVYGTELHLMVRGRDLQSGGLKEIVVSSSDAAEALEGPMGEIVALVVDTLKHTPPELAADLYDRGLILCGGGSLLRGLDERLRNATGLPVLRVEDPQACVVHGLDRLLSDPELFDWLASA